MPRLHFRIDTGYIGSAIVEPPLHKLHTFVGAPERRRIIHRHECPDDGPVVDCQGHVKWRIAVAGVDEVTCQECGETFPKRWRGCPRCNGDEMSTSMRQTRTVPTISYLRPGEYEVK